MYIRGPVPSIVSSKATEYCTYAHYTVCCSSRCNINTTYTQYGVSGRLRNTYIIHYIFKPDYRIQADVDKLQGKVYLSLRA